VGDGDDDQGGEEPEPGAGSTALRRGGTRRSMLAFRSVMSVLLRALGDFSLHPQGWPAGGRLRQPSSTGCRLFVACRSSAARWSPTRSSP
jgi:hypothetical protein